MEKVIQKATNDKAVATTGKGKTPTMQQYVEMYHTQIAKALPSVITPERFARIVTSAISKNPKLAQTTPKSFIGAMLQAAQLGLEPNTDLGQAYLIPYNNHGTLETQFQIGYKGMIALAYRSDVSAIQAHVVYENDEFEFSFGLDPVLKHVPAKTERGEPTHVYAVFNTKSGGYGFDVMSMDDVRKHAQKYSQSYNSSFSPWKTDFEEMAKKTVLKKTLKYAPLSSEFLRALSADETVKTEIADDMLDVPSIIDTDPSTGEVVKPEDSNA